MCKLKMFVEIILLLISFGIFFYRYLMQPHRYWQNLGVEYVKPTFFFGSFSSIVSQTETFGEMTESIYQQCKKRYIGFYQFLQPALLIRDPELIKTILIKEFDSFPEHKSFTSENGDPIWSKNLFAMKGGDLWHDMRSVLSPSFTSSKLKMMFPLMTDCADQLVNYLKEQGNDLQLEMKEIFSRFTNDVIATTAFGISCDSFHDKNNQFYHMGKSASNVTGKRNFSFFLNTVSPFLTNLIKIGYFTKEESDFFKDVIKRTIKLREEKGIVRLDMIHLLLEARKERRKNPEENSKKGKILIDDYDIIANAVVFYLAGFDTTSTAMSFTAYELAVNPDVQSKLRDEIDQVDVTYENLVGMKYLDMVVSEVLRKWPSFFGTDRIPIKPFTIQETNEKPLRLEKGIVCFIPIFSLHRDPKIYPNPDVFDPERFNEKNKQKSTIYMPFGLGPRNCIGSRFALLEIKLAITYLLKHYELIAINQTPIPLQLKKGSVHPVAEGGFWVGLKERHKPN